MSDQPFLRDLSSVRNDVAIGRHDTNEAAAIASREQMARDAAMYGAPRLPRADLPVIKEPQLPEDYAQRIAQLDHAIMKRGLPVNSDKLLSLGKQRFQELLAADRKARSWQKVADFTRFESVQTGLQAFEAATVPHRKTVEQSSGSGKHRDEVRRIESFDDLWKCTSERQELIDDVYRFHDAFETLRFGHEMLERLQSDGRARSRFFLGGREIGYLADWLACVDAPLARVTISQPVWSIVSWLADETAEAPTPVSVAQDFFNVRAPNDKQLRTAQALVTGFLLDYDGWHLWQYVGRRTRAAREMNTLADCRAALAKRFAKIEQFHSEVRSAFYRDVGYGYESHHEFDAKGWRAFVDSNVQKLLNRAGELVALGVEETFSGSVIARFQSSLLMQAKHKPQHKRASIARHLAMAFPAASFQLEFDQLP